MLTWLECSADSSQTLHHAHIDRKESNGSNTHWMMVNEIFTLMPKYVVWFKIGHICFITFSCSMNINFQYAKLFWPYCFLVTKKMAFEDQGV
jgi:hypothetical protein